MNCMMGKVECLLIRKGVLEWIAVRKRLALLFTAALMIGGCASNPSVSSLSPEGRAKLQSLQVLQGAPEREYSVLGSVEGLSCHRNAYSQNLISEEEAMHGVLVSAAALGADAVINNYCQSSGADWANNCHASIQCYGEAVAFVGEDISPDLLIIKESAEAGVAKAQYFLGLAYNGGDGVPQDKGKAFSWFSKAATQGYPAAQLSVGSAYLAEEDPAQAFIWFKKAAEQNVPEAQFLLGGLYATGEGVPQNHERAAHWFLKASEQGLTGAQYSLGLAYQYGLGVPQSNYNAYVWFAVASARGEKDAVKIRDSVGSKLSSVRLSDAQRKAALYFEQYPPPKDVRFR